MAAKGWFLLDVSKLFREQTLSGNAGPYMMPLMMLRHPGFAPPSRNSKDVELAKVWNRKRPKNKKK